MNKRTIQPVSFNTQDAYEKELLDFALKQQKYFSRYVKRLIEADRAIQLKPRVMENISLPIVEVKKMPVITKQTVRGFL